MYVCMNICLYMCMVELRIKDGEPDVPFLLSWANEPWYVWPLLLMNYSSYACFTFCTPN